MIDYPSESKPTILVTGGSGFVGQQILKVASALDTNLRLILRDTAHVSLNTNYKVVISPDLFLETSDWWAQQCDGVDTVIHLAWYTHPLDYLNSIKNIDCLQGSLNLARGAIAAGVKRFVGVGTCFEYDTSFGNLSVDTPLKPETLYASAKASLFNALQYWLSEHSVEFAWCRLFFLYGENEHPLRLASYIKSRIANDLQADLTQGTQVRDFLDVKEAGRLILEHSLGHNTGPINICSGIPITVRQMSEKIADQYGGRHLLNFGARRDNPFDPARVVGVQSR